MMCHWRLNLALLEFFLLPRLLLHLLKVTMVPVALTRLTGEGTGKTQVQAQPVHARWHHLLKSIIVVDALGVRTRMYQRLCQLSFSF
jgi:hypothetical protein